MKHKRKTRSTGILIDDTRGIVHIPNELGFNNLVDYREGSHHLEDVLDVWKAVVNNSIFRWKQQKEA